MQRVRIGLTGLGFVFVAVLLAAALTGEPQAEQPITENNLAARDNAQATHPQEPLAELGAAPGNADANAADPAANPVERAFR